MRSAAGDVDGASVGAVEGTSEAFALSEQQVNYFEAFGFLSLPGLFRREIGAISEAFDEVVADTGKAVVLRGNDYHRVRDEQYADTPRLCFPLLLEQHPQLLTLLDDPRIVAIAKALIGDDYEYAHSDGNLFNCDVLWHLDAFGSPIEQSHIKIYFYLDELTHDSGALRVMPGTHELGGAYALSVRGLFNQPEVGRQRLGVELDAVPSCTIEVQPGDLVIGNYRTMHASFKGAPGRRLFTVNFRAPLASATPA